MAHEPRDTDAQSFPQARWIHEGCRVDSHIDHLPAFSIDPPGVLVLTRHWVDGETWMTVKRADPVVDFTDELLAEVGGDNDGMYPDVRLEFPYHHSMGECRTDGKGPCFNNALLHIDARDRHVVYRIGEHMPNGRWRARWPD